METPLDVLSRAASLVHADDEKREFPAALGFTGPAVSGAAGARCPPPVSPQSPAGTRAGSPRSCAPSSVRPANGDYRKEHRERSRSPIERAAAPTVSLHANHMYTSIPSLSMEQPLALTKNSLDAARTVGISPSLSGVERQQNRPSVITCASANNRNCNLSHCPIAHSACSGAAYRRPSSCKCHPAPGRDREEPPLKWEMEMSDFLGVMVLKKAGMLGRKAGRGQRFDSASHTPIPVSAGNTEA
uniref:Vestigial like family member 4 n=1 Tax=Junco hyemalis TaxID=40217 RepID=A0A8C5IJU7_JUNHY